MSAIKDFFPTTPLWTPQIQRCAEFVAEWVANDLPGAHIWGLPRIGKSDFAKFLQRVLATILSGDVTVMIWSFHGFAPSNADMVLQRCLTESGCGAISSRKRPALQMRLVEQVLERCEKAGTKRFVSVIDEMQNVPGALYPVFASIATDLSSAGRMPFLLSIGQPEMAQTVKLLHDTHQLQTIGRFFPCVERFHPLTFAEVREMLENMDGPQGSFTRQWFPERAQQGWRISELAAVIESGGLSLAREMNFTAKPRMPMNWLRPALNEVFRHLSLNPSAVVDTACMAQCFKRVGFDRVMHYYVQ